MTYFDRLLDKLIKDINEDEEITVDILEKFDFHFEAINSKEIPPRVVDNYFK